MCGNGVQLHRTSQQGFSLIEMLTASLILAIVLLGVAMIYPRAMSAITTSADRAKASNLAQTKLEELFESASSCDKPSELREGAFEDRPDPRFARTWSVVRDRRERNIADLSVTVTWQDMRRERSVTLRTLVAIGGTHS